MALVSRTFFYFLVPNHASQYPMLDVWGFYHTGWRFHSSSETCCQIDAVIIPAIGWKKSNSKTDKSARTWYSRGIEEVPSTVCTESLWQLARNRRGAIQDAAGLLGVPWNSSWSCLQTKKIPSPKPFGGFLSVSLSNRTIKQTFAKVVFSKHLKFIFSKRNISILKFNNFFKSPVSLISSNTTKTSKQHFPAAAFCQDGSEGNGTEELQQLPGDLQMGKTCEKIGSFCTGWCWVLSFEHYWNILVKFTYYHHPTNDGTWTMPKSNHQIISYDSMIIGYTFSGKLEEFNDFFEDHPTRRDVFPVFHLFDCGITSEHWVSYSAKNYVGNGLNFTIKRWFL